MKANLTYLKNVIFLVVWCGVLIQGAANLIRRKPSISSERNFIWFFLFLIAIYLIDSFGISVTELWQHPELFYTSVGLGVYLIVAVIIISILVARGKVSYGYTISGAEADSVSQATSQALDGLDVQYAFNHPDFYLPAANSTLEVKYYKWQGGARLRIKEGGNQELLNRVARSLRQDNGALLRFNNRASLIELSIGLVGSVYYLSKVLTG